MQRRLRRWHESICLMWWHSAFTVTSSEIQHRRLYCSGGIHAAPQIGGQLMLKQLTLASILALTTSLSAMADDGKITVHVTGLKNDQGVVRLALFNSADSYDKSKSSDDKAAGAFKKDVAPIKSGSSTYTF